MAEVFIFGAGGIGSYATVALAPKHKIHISDFDRVEPKNSNNQIYLESDAGNLKVDVLRTLYGDRVVTYEKDEDMIDEIGGKFYVTVIVATDSLSTRLKIMRELSKHCEYQRRNFAIIDARTNASISNVYVFSSEYINYYIKKLESEIATIERANPGVETNASSCRVRGNQETDNTSGMRTAWMIFYAMETLLNKGYYTKIGFVFTFLRDKITRSEIVWET